MLDTALAALAPIVMQLAGGPAAESPNEFLPHGFCYLWNRPLLWTHVLSDALIGVSYVSISGTLAYLLHRMRRDIPFSVIFVAFGLFIVTCGATHFMEIWTLWQPVYWLSGAVKVVTAVASVSTAAVLPFTVPKVRSTIGDAKLARERELAVARAAALEEANRELSAARERAEEARHRADEANRAKSDFLAVMSHELRTPLNAVMGYSELMAMGVSGPLTDQQGQQLARIKASATHLVGLIDQILGFARIDAGREQVRVEQFDAAALAREVAELVEPLAAGQGLTITVNTPPRAVWMASDLTKVRQVLMNLLSNAIKFTPAGGVTVTVRSVRSEEDQVVFEVRDTGVGIAPEHHARVFDPFWQVEQGMTRRVGGAGLGLSVVRQLTTLLGGEVTLESEVGRGSTFRVTLPATSAGRAAGDDETPAPGARGGLLALEE